MVSGFGRWAAVTVLTALSATGCASNQSGQEPPEVQSPAPQPAPERPQELSIAGKPSSEFCNLLAPEQQSQLGVGRWEPLPADQGVGCGWLSLPGVQPDVGIQLQALQMGFDEAADRSGEPFPETADSYTLQGFPARQSQSSAGLEGLGCRVDVDVANGQALEAFYTPAMAGSVSNQDMCAKAKQAAEFAVTNLQAQG